MDFRRISVIEIIAQLEKIVKAEKIDEILEEMRDQFIERIEEALGGEPGTVGNKEPEVPGEMK